MNALFLSLTSGLLLGVAFLPRFGLIAWMALVPFCMVLRGLSPRRAFLHGLAFALPLFIITQYPLMEALHQFGKLPLATSAMLVLLLILVLAAAMAAAPCLAAWLAQHTGGAILGFLPAAWVAVEYARTECYPFGGYPWCLLAQTQAEFPWLLQPADLVGGIGLSFAIVWVNLCLAEAIRALCDRRGSSIMAPVFLAVLPVSVIIGYGLFQSNAMEREMAAAQSLRVGLVQGNIEQREKWAATEASRQLRIHQELTQQLATAQAELIIWPEAAFPGLLSLDAPRLTPATFGISLRERGASLPLLLIGAVTVGVVRGGAGSPPDFSEREFTSRERIDAERRFYNSALLFDAGAALHGVYHKTHLVPFGEYVPYKKLIFFARKLVQSIGEITPGAVIAPIVYGQLALGPLICFEDIFPSISRRMVSQGANLLVNLTNDAWYGNTAFPYQHHAHAVLRAVETRRYVIRATNSGVSSIIDPTGRVLVASHLFERSVQSGKVRLLDVASPYVRFGDWFAWGCVSFLMIGIIQAMRRKRL